MRGIEFHDVYPELLLRDGAKREAQELASADLIVQGARYVDERLEVPLYVVKAARLEMEHALEQRTAGFQLEKLIKQKAQEVYLLLGKFTGEHTHTMWKNPEVQRQKDDELKARVEQVMSELGLEFYDLTNKKAVMNLMRLFYEISSGERTENLIAEATAILDLEMQGMDSQRRNEHIEQKAKEVIVSAIYT